METQDEIYEKYKSYQKTIFEFEPGENDFKPAHYKPKEEGVYATLRCGLQGIYQTLDQYKEGKWQLRALDGSEIIAYSKYKIEL